MELQKEQNKRVSIIIVTFESANIIENCLSKINFDKYEVFVVDNASKDATTKIVEEKFPKTHLIKLTQNIGYGRANNVALRQVVTEYALILNPDAFIEDSELERNLVQMDCSPDVAIGAPLLLDNFPAQDSEIRKQKAIVQGNLIEKLAENKASVKYIIGAIVFLRMSVFKKIGFYDENIFMYYEDDEICFNAIENGYKCVVFEDIIGFHIGGASCKKTFRTIYKRHLHTYLSKMYWKKKRKGHAKAVMSAIRLLFLNLILAIFNVFSNHQKLAKNLGYMVGVSCFLLNLKPFKKNGEARG